MPTLCKHFDITINDLFSGEIVDMKNTEKNLDTNLLELTKLKEQKDKQLLSLEWVLGGIAVATLLTLVIIAATIEMPDWTRWTILGIAFALFFVAIFFALRIEQIAGYYKCAECGHKYVPKYWPVFVARHMGRTRHLRCPKCGKKSWQKKVL